MQLWTRPSHYIGADWTGYLVAPVTQTRDSDTLTRSNFAAQWETLAPLAADVPGEDERAPVIVRESHWACGWVEWVAVHPSNAAAVRAGEEIAEALERYPVLNEEAHSALEWQEYGEAWNSYGCRDYAEALGLSDAATDALADNPEQTRALYEAAIPSGEYYTPEDDGVRLNRHAANMTERDAIAATLRAIRAHRLWLCCVSYRDGTLGDGAAPFVFECLAEDENHAREQCENAEPGCTIIGLAWG